MNTPSDKGQKSYIEFMDDFPTGDRIINIKLTKRDLMKAKLTKWDYLLFDDIQNGKKSATPLADQILGLETLVRRIEEANALAPTNPQTEHIKENE